MAEQCKTIRSIFLIIFQFLISNFQLPKAKVEEGRDEESASVGECRYLSS
ncbi:hypothetical protein PRABACTJOHN_02155 [Parabacteroides johnsonii DSM 18315]|uniref:Uncharacterized protein n=1 Tax=Parabacteroides johnsonii DSM 18315 TaxID=537006 RepID=B7BAU6_9BACT|nr:hypothetical protein PRABACTJOHN_02155 [Parabacteroides johnsonii DSM 18315]